MSTIVDVIDNNEATLADAAATNVSGATGFYGTDDTAAIEEAYSWTAYALPQVAYNGGIRGIATARGGPTLRFSSGRYIYNGNALHSNEGSARGLSIAGEGALNTQVNILSDDYFFRKPSNATLTLGDVYIRDITFVGGKGLFRNDYGDPPQGMRIFDKVRVLGFSECAIGSVHFGQARWAITDCWIETKLPDTKGIVFPAGVAHPNMSGTNVLGCRIGVQLPKEGGTNFLSGMTFFNVAGNDQQCAIWVGAKDSGKHWIRENRFSNENRDGKPWIIVADGDGTGDNEIDEWPDLTDTGGKVTGLYISDNHVTAAGNADATGDAEPSSFVQCYVADIGQTRVFDNELTQAHDLVWEWMVPPTRASDDLKIGPNWIGGAPVAEPWRFSNYDVGVFDYGDGVEVGSPSSISPSTGWSPQFRPLSVTTAGALQGIADLSAFGSGTTIVADETDHLGNANGAALVTFGGTFADGAHEIRLVCADATTLGSLVDGQNIYVEVPYKAAGSEPLGEIDIEARFALDPGPGAVVRPIPVTPGSEWRIARIPCHVAAGLGAFWVRIYASPDSFEAGVADKVILGPVTVYAGNKPVETGHMVHLGHGADRARRRNYIAGTSAVVDEYYDNKGNLHVTTTAGGTGLLIAGPAMGFLYSTAEIADDGYAEVDVATVVPGLQTYDYYLKVFSTAVSANAWGEAFKAGNILRQMSAGTATEFANNTAYGTGDPVVEGTDAKLNISVAGNKLYINNRLGSATVVTFAIGPMVSSG